MLDIMKPLHCIVFTALTVSGCAQSASVSSSHCPYRQSGSGCAGVQQEPSIEHFDGTDAVYNDPALAQRLTGTLVKALGKDNVVPSDPLMVSEDFTYFTEQNIPSFYFQLGGANPAKYAQAKASGEKLPFNHSLLFAPDVDPTLRTGIFAEVAVLRDLLNGRM